MERRTTVRAILAALAAASAAGLWWHGPIPQDPGYHHFADQRTLLGIPNALDVLSNVPIGAAGAWGLLQARMRATPWALWAAVGLLLTGIGSSYYHAVPDSPRLFWDRLPLTVVFMAWFAAVLADRAQVRLLWPLLLVGVASVLYWRATDDLRPYAWVQFFPMLALLLLVVALPGRDLSTRGVLWVIALYAAAKAGEALDRPIFALTGVVSGHTLKHLIAGVAGFRLLALTPATR